MKFFAIIFASVFAFSATSIALAQATCNPAVQVCR